MKILKMGSLSLALLCSVPVMAVEYFVAPDGDNAAAGTGAGAKPQPICRGLLNVGPGQADTVIEAW